MNRIHLNTEGTMKEEQNSKKETSLRLLCASSAIAFALALSALALPAKATAQVSCPDTITTKVVLTEDVICPPGATLQVEGPGGRLVMRDHEVSCPDGGSVELVGEHAVVKGGSITDCDVNLLEDGAHQLARMILRQAPVEVTSDNNRLVFNKSVNSPSEGFDLDAASGNLLLKNIIKNPTQEGVELDSGSDNNVVVGNEVSGATNGLEIGGNSQVRAKFNIFVLNTVRNSNGAAGIIVQGSDNDVALNHVKRNKVGIFLLEGATRNRIARNDVLKSEETGVLLVPPFVGETSDNQIVGNHVLDNKGNGIHLELGATENEILRNRALGNKDIDLVDSNADCDDNVWNFNRFETSNNPTCID